MQEKESGGKIKFQVETQRVLEILTNDIYDSPYVLLRENIQNAYDAILMRIASSKDFSLFEGKIDVTLKEGTLIISDNGIGMTEEVVTNNYWKAGSSGKKSEIARKAGVVGTFGIGAMANFGVSTKLKVETRPIGSETTLITIAEREKLSLTEECIDLQKVKNGRSYGTTITAYLDSSVNLIAQTALNYIEPYVKFLPIPVFFNGQLISQRDYKKSIIPEHAGLVKIPPIKISDQIFNAELEIFFDQTGRLFIKLTNIKIHGIVITGDLALAQGNGSIMGLRSYFGLAPIPINSYYRLSGIANLSILLPTAGREAISRESINDVSRLIKLAERIASEEISKLELADRNNSFMQYIVSNNRYDLADNIKVDIYPSGEKVPLGKIINKYKDKKIYYYLGSDSTIIKLFSTETSYLIVINQLYPRRQIQDYYIKTKLKLEEAPNKVTIVKTYSPTDLTLAEAALVVRIASVIQEDYLIRDIDILYADISHGVSFYVIQKSEGRVQIYIDRKSSAIFPILNCYQNAYDVFHDFVKDFVRTQLYSLFSQYVPSATKQGADALQEILRKNQELYRLEFSDFGKIDSLIGDYISGDVPLSEVIRSSISYKKSQSEIVSKESIAKVENEIPDLITSPVNITEQPLNAQNQNGSIEHGAASKSDIDDFGPAPPIMRRESETESKVLTVNMRYVQLNNFRFFLSLSQKLFRTELDFFLQPHSTKVIWGSHRIIYIFTHISKNLTLYYNIELKEPLAGSSSAGGKSLETTTIITKNRIYIPIPDELTNAFKVVIDPKEFFVRYDYITG